MIEQFEYLRTLNDPLEKLLKATEFQDNLDLTKKKSTFAFSKLDMIIEGSAKKLGLQLSV